MSTLEFNQLVASNASYLKGFAYTFTKNVEDAEDLLQDTLLKALRYKDHFADGTNFRGWLYTIMRSIFINAYKRRKLQRTILTNNPFLGNRNSSDDVSSVINEKDINRTMTSLAYDFQKPFQMYIDGYHYEEIASAMSIPLGTVKSRIYHARKKMMDELSNSR